MLERLLRFPELTALRTKTIAQLERVGVLLDDWDRYECWGNPLDEPPGLQRESLELLRVALQVRLAELDRTDLAGRRN